MPKIQPKIQPAFYSRGISFARRKEESRFLCKFAVPTEKGGLWAMRLEAFPSCAGMEKRIGMLNIHKS